MNRVVSLLMWWTFKCQGSFFLVVVFQYLRDFLQDFGDKFKVELAPEYVKLVVVSAFIIFLQTGECVFRKLVVLLEQPLCLCLHVLQRVVVKRIRWAFWVGHDEGHRVHHVLKVLAPLEHQTAHHRTQVLVLVYLASQVLHVTSSR